MKWRIPSIGKAVKACLSVALTAYMIMGLAACGDASGSSILSVEAPINILVDSSVVSEGNGLRLFVEDLEELMGVGLRFFRVDSSTYGDMLDDIFSGENCVFQPDIVYLNPRQYTHYAESGVLADITDIWEASELRKSGRITYEQVVDDLRIGGRLYGIAPATGNGYITYVRQSWLERARITELPTNYEEYIRMLRAFSEISPDGYALTSTGIINKENPYVNYLPEFLWDACPSFYRSADGMWVDGFLEERMADALERLAMAYREGLLDPDYAENEVYTCHDKFAMDRCGVFTYWAGTGARILVQEAQKYGTDERLVPLPPIAEVGAYTENPASVWAVTSTCKNPDKVFDLFFGTMLDGAEGQVLWTYGVEDVHWSTRAETITIGKGAKAVSYYYEEGEFHAMLNMENGNSLCQKNHLDPLLAIVDFFYGKDVGAELISLIERKSQEVLKAGRKAAPEFSFDPAIGQMQEEIMSVKIDLTNRVVSGELSVEAAMEEYNKRVGGEAQEVLHYLNNPH